MKRQPIGFIAISHDGDVGELGSERILWFESLRNYSFKVVEKHGMLFAARGHIRVA